VDLQLRAHRSAAGVTIAAIVFNEDQSEGYCFKVIGHEEGDLLEWLARLVAKMRRGLEDSLLDEGSHGLQVSDGGIVRARIEGDPRAKPTCPCSFSKAATSRGTRLDGWRRATWAFRLKLELHALSDET
jgi:hypothetical protein